MSTPKLAGSIFAIFFFLAFMILGRVAYLGSFNRRSAEITAGSDTEISSSPEIFEVRNKYITYSMFVATCYFVMYTLWHYYYRLLACKVAGRCSSYYNTWASVIIHWNPVCASTNLYLKLGWTVVSWVSVKIKIIWIG